MSNPSNPALEVWEEIDEGIKRLVTQGSAMTVTRYRLSPGSGFRLHRHSQEQIVYVVSGGITVFVGEQEHHLTQGITLIIGPSMIHKAVADPDGAEVLSVVAPARTADTPIEMLEG